MKKHINQNDMELDCKIIVGKLHQFIRWRGMPNMQSICIQAWYGCMQFMWYILLH